MTAAGAGAGAGCNWNMTGIDIIVGDDRGIGTGTSNGTDTYQKDSKFLTDNEFNTFPVMMPLKLQ